MQLELNNGITKVLKEAELELWIRARLMDIIAMIGRLILYINEARTLLHSLSFNLSIIIPP